MTEHAAELMRKRYELLSSCGMSNNEIWRDSQRMAVWDTQGQHVQKGDRITSLGDMNADATVSYSVYQYTANDERIMARPPDICVFRVTDAYIKKCVE